MDDRARALLWHLHAELAALPTSAWPEALAACAARASLAGRCHPQLDDPPPMAAIRVAHAVGMGAPGLQAWAAQWPTEGAALRMAVAAAPLLAGRADLQLLVAPAGEGMEREAALVDGESCARMAVVGYDPEIELQIDNCAGLLHSCGDLRWLGADGGFQPAGRRFLVAGIRSHAPAGH